MIYNSELNNISVKQDKKQMDNNSLKHTSYQDLLKSFQQAEVTVPTPRSKKLIYRPQHSKQTSSNLKSNKENLPKTHHQSQYDKSVSQKS